MVFETIEIGSSAVGLNAGAKLGCKKVFMTLETAQIRFRYDGVNPTATIGHILNPNDVLRLEGIQIQNFKAIRTGSTSGLLSVTYEGM